jgi:four helix bundle protein
MIAVLGSQFSVFRCHRPHGTVNESVLAEAVKWVSHTRICSHGVWRWISEIYRATEVFPRDELYGLRSQLRRAAVSVPSSIAEGQARFSKKEFHHFLSVSRGSLVEIETQLMISQNLGYLTLLQVSPLLQRSAQLGKVLNGLIASIKSAA